MFFRLSESADGRLSDKNNDGKKDNFSNGEERAEFMTDYTVQIREYIEKEKDVLSCLDVQKINEVMNLLEEKLSGENMIYVFGNGGSAATASHYQNDFNKGISEHTDKKFRFQCLNDNAATVMAIANDIGYGEVFRFQLEGRLRPGDICIGISGSGNSENVVKAAQYAKSQGNQVVGITGYDGGKLKEIADYSLHVPVQSMQITEDVHMVFDHLMMSIFYQTMCGIDHIKEQEI